MTDWTTIDFEYKPISKYSNRPGPAAFVVIHHACCTTLEQVYATFAGSRQASTHYAVEGGRDPWQFVYDKYAAWSTGNDFGNSYGISIEHCNSALGDASGWPVSDATIDVGAHLTAALHLYYGWGRPTRATVKYHQEFYSTACPVTLIAKIDSYVAKSAAWYDKMNTPKEPPVVEGFSDLFASTSHIEEIKLCIQKGWMLGYPVDGTWRPDGMMSRRDVLVTLMRKTLGTGAFELPAISNFFDVPNNDLDTYKAANWAKVNGIANGYVVQAIPTLQPWALVCRNDAAAFLWRSLGQPTASSKATFPDVPSGYPHKDAIDNLAGLGVIKGYADGLMHPDWQVRRGDWAAFLARASALGK